MENTAQNATRGYRNNNPCNIRYSTLNKWQGQKGSDGAFCVFDTMQNGLRAAFKLLKNYHSAGNNTIAKIINRWAPESENNTSAYITTVESKCGVHRDQTLLFDYLTYATIVRAMCQVESKYTPTDSQLKKAYDSI